MDAEETNNDSLRRCLICWELKGPNDFLHDDPYGLHGRNEYCATCDTIQRAHTKAYLAARFDWEEPSAPFRFVLDGFQIGERWRDYIVEYLYGSIWAAMTQRYIFPPERYRGAAPPTLGGDGITPLVWRIRLFHTQRKGYAEGWWNPQTRQWDWSLNKIDPDMSTVDWSEWRKVVRDAASVGRPHGNALVYLSTVSAFLTRCKEVVSHGWPEAANGMDAITQKQTLRRVREGTVTQAQLGEILGCGHRTITLALARFKESDHLDWRDLQRWLAEWSREP